MFMGKINGLFSFWSWSGFSKRDPNPESFQRHDSEVSGDGVSRSFCPLSLVHDSGFGFEQFIKLASVEIAPRFSFN